MDKMVRSTEHSGHSSIRSVANLMHSTSLNQVLSKVNVENSVIIDVGSKYTATRKLLGVKRGIDDLTI